MIALTSSDALHDPAKDRAVDGLRGIAILMVCVFHGFGAVHGFYLPWHGWLRDLRSSANQAVLSFYPISFGWAGVALFFVLSGFCIHLSFLRNSHFNLLNFFWRRFWRIYPAYVVALLVFAFVAHVDLFTVSGGKQILSHLLFLHNFSDSTFLGINPSFWSIATEVQLYLLYPVLLFVHSRFGIGICLLVTFVIGLVWRGVAVYVWGLPDHLITPALSGPMMTWFDWSLGAFVAERFFHGKRVFNNKRISLSVLLILLVASTLYKPLTIFSFSLAAAAAAVVLEAVLSQRGKISRWVTVFSSLGTVSYSLYLWHQPRLLSAVRRIEAATGSLLFSWLAVTLLTIGVAWISFRFIEREGIKLGNSLWRGIRSVLVITPARELRGVDVESDASENHRLSAVLPNRNCPSGNPAGNSGI